MPRWPIGAHWCQHAYTEARELGLSFCWLHADGLGDDPRSRELHDARGTLASGLRYVLQFSLHGDRLTNQADWCGHVEQTRDRLRDAGALDRCLAPQMGDEFYSNLSAHGGDLHAAAIHVAARANDVRRIMGGAVGAGVGMAETGAVLPPVIGIDWWGLNVYWAWGYHDRATVARLYADAVRLGKPIMPVLPVFCDAPWPPMPLDPLARCYLPLLEQHATSIFAVGLFCLHHPSTYQDGHRPGRGILELPPVYAAGVRVLTEMYGR